MVEGEQEEERHPLIPPLSLVWMELREAGLLFGEREGGGSQLNALPNLGQGSRRLFGEMDGPLQATSRRARHVEGFYGNVDKLSFVLVQAIRFYHMHVVGPTIPFIEVLLRFVTQNSPILQKRDLIIYPL